MRPMQGRARHRHRLTKRLMGCPRCKGTGRHHRYRKTRGLAPIFYWSSIRGPYASVRLPGAFRVGHQV
jgi:hypothetical protein